MCMQQSMRCGKAHGQPVTYTGMIIWESQNNVGM